MKNLLIPIAALLLLSCNKFEFPADVQIEVFHNDNKWEITQIHSKAANNDTWSFGVDAKRSVHKEYRYTETIFFYDIPTIPGTYGVKVGFPGIEGPDHPVSVELHEVHHDVSVTFRVLDTLANNYVIVNGYDEQSGIINGSIYTEWIKTKSDKPGPDRQIIKTNFFQFVLDESGK